MAIIIILGAVARPKRELIPAKVTMGAPIEYDYNKSYKPRKNMPSVEFGL